MYKARAEQAPAQQSSSMLPWPSALCSWGVVRNEEGTEVAEEVLEFPNFGRNGRYGAVDMALLVRLALKPITPTLPHGNNGLGCCNTTLWMATYL